MREFTWRDGLRPGGRRVRLYLARAGEAVKFDGDSIDGWCQIAAHRSARSGKWSSTEYTLLLSPGVHPIEFLSPLHGTWGQEFQSWGEASEHLSLPVEKCQEIVRAEYPDTADRLDQVEKFALSHEEKGKQVEIVLVCFGSPTNRQIAAGWWKEPKSARTADGEVTVTVAPTIGDDDRPEWSKPVVVTPADATIVSSRHRSGMHGGTWTVEVGVPR